MISLWKRFLISILYSFYAFPTAPVSCYQQKVKYIYGQVVVCVFHFYCILSYKFYYCTT